MHTRNAMAQYTASIIYTNPLKPFTDTAFAASSSVRTRKNSAGDRRKMRFFAFNVRAICTGSSTDKKTPQPMKDLYFQYICQTLQIPLL